MLDSVFQAQTDVQASRYHASTLKAYSAEFPPSFELDDSQNHSIKPTASALKRLGNDILKAECISEAIALDTPYLSTIQKRAKREDTSNTQDPTNIL